MERGEERGIAIVVLSIISIVAMLGSIALFLKQPTGLVMQNTGVYVTEDAGNLAITCRNFQQTAYFLGYDGNYRVYCCMEDMIGQNECKLPHKVLITRTY